MATRMQDAKHLRNGDALPERAHPTRPIRLFSMRFCPFAERAHLVLHHHGIEFETVAINLSSKPDWYLSDYNPLGMVPAIEFPDGRVVYDSTIVCELLDKLYCGDEKTSLTASDPMEEANGRMVVELVQSIPFHRLLSVTNTSEEGKQVLDDMRKRLDVAAGRVKGPFILGEKVSMADLLLFSKFERFHAAEAFSGTAIPWRSNAVWARWFDAMLQERSVRNTIIPVEHHVQYWRGMMGDDKEKKLDAYDIGLALS